MTIRKFKKIHNTYANIKWLIDFCHTNLDKYNYHCNPITFSESRIITTFLHDLTIMYCNKSGVLPPTSFITMAKYNEVLDILRKLHTENEFDPLFDDTGSTIVENMSSSASTVSNEYSKPDNVFDEHVVKSNKNYTIKIKYNNKLYKVKSLICAFDSDGLAYYGFVTSAVTMWVSQNSQVELEISSIIGKSTVTVADTAPYRYFG